MKPDPAEEYHQQLARTVQYLQNINNQGTTASLYDIWKEDTEKKKAILGLAEQSAIDGQPDAVKAYAQQFIDLKAIS
jgi:hypothetical protein